MIDRGFKTGNLTGPADTRLFSIQDNAHCGSKGIYSGLASFVEFVDVKGTFVDESLAIEAFLHSPTQFFARGVVDVVHDSVETLPHQIFLYLLMPRPSGSFCSDLFNVDRGLRT